MLRPVPLLAALLSLGTAAVAPSPAGAQRPAGSARFVYLALAAEYASTADPDASPGPFDHRSASGPGVGGELGVSLLPWLDLFAGVDVASVRVSPRNLSQYTSGNSANLSHSAALRHVEGGARFRLPVTTRFSPYAEAGYLKRRMHYRSTYAGNPGGFGNVTGTTRFETSEEGTAPLLGLGFESVLSPSLTLDVGARTASGHYDDRTFWLDNGYYPDRRDPPTARSTRTRVAVRWYPELRGVAR